MNLIYSARSRTSNKIYIGQTSKSLEDRKHKHRIDAANGRNTYFCRAIRKYGFDDFEWVVIEECEPDHLNDREIYWIGLVGTCDKTIGYNISKGGGVNHLWWYDVVVRNEGRESADIKLQAWKENRTGENHYLYGKNYYDVWEEKFGPGVAAELWTSYLQKQKLSHAGKQHSLQAREKISAKVSGSKNPMYGKSLLSVWTEKYGEQEAEKLMSDYRTKHKEAHGGEKNGMYGKKVSNETREKISVSKKGKTFDGGYVQVDMKILAEFKDKMTVKELSEHFGVSQYVVKQRIKKI